MQNKIKHGECLSEETVADYLAGTLASVVSAACEIHLVGCDPCRQKLATLMHVLQPETTAAEDAMVDDAVQRWEQQYGGRIPTGNPKARGIPRWWIGLAAAAAIAVITWIGLVQNNPQTSAQAIVQSLLAQERPFVARLNEQTYRPITRAATERDAPRYAQLAEAMSERAATAYEWGRFYLVQEDYEKAIESLEIAAGDPNATAGVFNDLGVAYLQRARNNDRERAQREFDRSLEKEKEFLPALFNLSLAYETLGQPESAARYRKEYLRLDPDSEWAAEIRAREPR